MSELKPWKTISEPVPVKVIVGRPWKAIVYSGITFFLLGASLQLGFLWVLSRSFRQELWFTWTHPKEVQFARERFELIQEASRKLYFEDYNMEGVTIIKPVK